MVSDFLLGFGREIQFEVVVIRSVIFGGTLGLAPINLGSAVHKGNGNALDVTGLGFGVFL